MSVPKLTVHDRAVVALCLGRTQVADQYQFACMLGARRARRTVRAAGIPGAVFGATFSAAGSRP